MKKLLIFLGVIVGVLTSGVASASLYDYYAELSQNLPSVEARRPLAEQCGIYGYTGSKTQNIALEVCLRGEVKLGGAVPVRPTDFTTSLAQSFTEGHTGTTLKVTSITTRDNNTLASTTLGSLIVLSVNPGKSNSETVVCTSLTETTKTFTNCSFGYRFDNPTASSTANIKAHSPGETVIISNTDTYNAQNFLSTSGDAYITASNTIKNVWTFQEFPEKSGTLTATTSRQFVTKGYADALAIAGAPDGSITVKGIYEQATATEIASSTITGGTTAPLVITTANTTSSPYTTGKFIPVTENNGKINQTFLNLTESFTFSASSSFTSTTLFTASSSLYRFADDTGSANIYLVTSTPAVLGYPYGMRVSFKAVATSTAASTLNVNSQGAKTLKKAGHQLGVSDIKGGQIYTAVYDGVGFQLVSPVGGATNLAFLAQNASLTAATSTIGPGAGNLVQDMGVFIVPFDITVNKVSVNIITETVAGSVTFGMWTEDGQTNIVSSTFAVGGTGVRTLTLSSPVRLSPGLYYSGFTAVGTANYTYSSWSCDRSPIRAFATGGVSASPIFCGRLAVNAGMLTPTFDPTTLTYTENSAAIIYLSN